MSRFTRAVTLAFLAFLLALFGAGGALAGAQWCDTDPPVALSTASGVPLRAHLTIGVAGVAHQAALDHLAIKQTGTVGALGVGTNFTVVVPGAGFATRLILSSEEDGGGIVYGYMEGEAGQPMTVGHFDLRVRHVALASGGSGSISGCNWYYGWCSCVMHSSVSNHYDVVFYTTFYGNHSADPQGGWYGAGNVWFSHWFDGHTTGDLFTWQSYDANAYLSGCGPYS